MDSNTNSCSHTLTLTIESIDGDIVFTKDYALNPSKEWIEKLHSSQEDK